VWSSVMVWWSSVMWSSVGWSSVISSVVIGSTIGTAYRAVIPTYWVTGQ
jgi:hypothetical protein